MISIAWAFDGLIGAALMSLVISALGSAAALCCREPVRRMRVIMLTLAACLLAPLLAFVPGLPRWSLPERATAIGTADAKPQASAIAFREAGTEQVGGAAVGVELIEATIPVPGPDTEPGDDPDPERVIAVNGATRAGSEIHDELSESPASPATMLGTSHSARAPAVSRPAAPPINVRNWALGIYLAGLAGLSAWWLVGWVALRRVLRAARPAPESCRELLREIAGPASDGVALLVSTRAAQPFTFGWRRPVIVLPEEMCRDSAIVEQQFIPLNGEAQPSTASPASELRWSLAHEWAHVVHKDVCVWSLASLVRTVYFYQPLCWWLRAQLRLCQDYLADAAAAARETSPEAYAEFLATRAVGRPLAYGLGIAGGQSDLYRRVAMLVKNRRTLETRCPWWWSAGAASMAIALVVVAATFGEKRPLAAADDRPGAVAAAADKKGADEKNSGAKNPGALKSAQTKPGKPTPAKVEKESGDPALKKLLEGLFAREKAIKSGHFTARIEWGQTKPRSAQSGMRGGGGAADMATMMRTGGPPGRGSRRAGAGMSAPPAMGMGMVAGSPGGPAKEIELIVSGESWLQRPGPSGEDVFINHGGRSLSYRGHRQSQPTVNINWPVTAGGSPNNRTFVPLRGGTIWYPESVSYLREHAADATLAGKVKADGVEAQAIEWRIPPADAALAFVDPGLLNGLLGGGGTYRVAVSPQLDYAVVRIEYIDRFGTTQSAFDFSDFKKVAAGIYFPDHFEIREGALEQTIDVVSVAKINEKIENREFVLSVPPGTQVTDERPHRDDTFSSSGEYEYDGAKYPLRNFTTGAEYPEGLPAAMLEEMDRDVFTPEEFRSHVAALAEANATLPKRTPAGKRTGRAVGKNALSYGGKNFNEWRNVLLGDLEPKTRTQALTALAAFAGNGYAEEVAAAIAEAVKVDDDAAGVDLAVLSAASEALVRCGKAGVPALEAQLASKMTPARLGAVQALARLAATTDTVIPPLLKAVNDRDGATRGIAYRALAAHHSTAPGVADKLAEGLRDEQRVRHGIVEGLSTSQAPPEEIVKLVTPLFEDDDTTVRAIAGAIFAARSPATPENVERLRNAVLDGGSQARKVFVEKLRDQQQSREISPELTVPILVALLESRDSYRDLNGYQVIFAQMIFGIIDKMPHDHAAVQTAIPVLIKSIDLELPDKEGAVWAGFVDYQGRGNNTAQRHCARPSLVLAAAESLGRFGPAAKDAAPSLKKLVEPGWLEHHDLQDVRMETEKQWQTRIQAIISRIEGK